MSVPALKPDVPGLVDAQRRLRDYLGRDVRFYGPADVIYDESIPASAFDDEGIPLDPLASGTASGAADVGIANLVIVGSAHCSVVFQPLAAMRRDTTDESALGVRSHLNKDLILDIADKSQTDGATYFMVGTLARDASGAIIYAEEWTPDDGELWKIANAKSDGFGGLQRYVVFGYGTR